MNRLLLGTALLLLAAWLACTGDKAANGGEKAGRNQGEGRNFHLTLGTDAAPASLVDDRPRGWNSNFAVGSSELPQTDLLGQPIDDGPLPTGKRVRNDGVALKDVPADK